MKKLQDCLPQEIKNIYHFIQAGVSAVLFGFPSRKLKVIGVTGTDGKTTTVNLIHHILKSSGIKVSMISTVKAQIGEVTFDTGLHVTTPSPFQLQKFLKMMLKAESEIAVLEVTSHALDQNRVAFIDFYEGVITNITHEHMDYHKSYESYLKAKSKILNKVKYRVLNSDDSSFKKLSDVGSGKMVSFGVSKDADVQASDVKNKRDGVEFVAILKNGENTESRLKISSSLIGNFNIYNILAAVASIKNLGLDSKKIESSISTFPGVEGRLERINEGQDFDVVVDFAHTPNAFSNILQTLKGETKGNLICIFGSAGDRDKDKRPNMGEIAGKICNYAVITAEDPRGEDVNKIAEEIASGIKKSGGVQNKTFWIIPERKAAIEWTIKSLAKSGDTVAILGKGHEKSMNIGGKEYQWSDQMTAKEAIYERLKK